MNQYVKSQFKLKVRCLHYHMGQCYRKLDSPKDCRRLQEKPCKHFEEIIVPREDFEDKDGQTNLF